MNNSSKPTEQSQLLPSMNGALQQKLQKMFKFSTQSEEIKSCAARIISKRDHKHVKRIVDVDDVLNPDRERDIQARLERWRQKEREHDFKESIKLLQIQELVPRTIVQSKLKQLEEY